MSAVDGLVLLPVVVPLLTAVACTLARPTMAGRVGVAGAAVNLAGATWLLAAVARDGVLVSALGGWPAPLGVPFAADRLGAATAALGALLGLATACFALPTLDDALRAARFMALLHLLLAGMGGFFLTADLFNFYVWYELVLVASFGLLVLEGGGAAVEGATKYLTVNLVGSMLLLICVGLLYAITGRLDLVGVGRALQALDVPHLTAAIAALALVAVGIKGAIFPLFSWLPASYPVAPIAVTALFGGLLTKVAIFGLLRLFTLVFPLELAYLRPAVLALAALTMITGVLGAMVQRDVVRLLAFHVVSQNGYLLMGLGLHGTAGLAAASFFLLHVALAKTALFFVGGIVGRVAGGTDLGALGGLQAARPGLALLFLVPALSLGGIPPLSGFPAKLSLVQEGLAQGRYAVVAAALGVSLLTLWSMTKVWTRAFQAPAPADGAPTSAPVPALMWGPAVALALATALLGLGAGPVLDFLVAGSGDLLDPSRYAAAVLPGEVP